MSSKNSSGLRSIAWSISFDFWMREFAHLLVLNLVLAGAVAAAFAIWCEQQIPAGGVVDARDLMGMDDLETAAYVLTLASGKTCEFLLLPFLTLCRIPAIAVLSLEGLFIFGNLFSVGTIRRKMKPLHEVAIRTDELTRNSMTGAAAAAGKDPAAGPQPNLKTMEKAISRLNPDMPDARVVTGDKELQSLEIAINNLLDRMRESRRQQERFVSDASHELRTPIAVIQGYVNMLDRWGKDDEQILKESIEALKNESEHMKNLVEQLLFLARGDSGRNTLHFEVCNLVEMVQDVMEESAMIDEKHEYRFETADMSATSPDGRLSSIPVSCDPAMLKQSMRIFVQNAAKYSAEGNVITLRAGLAPAEPVSGNAARPFYSVQDEGVGMESSEVVHIFERFYRSDSARNSSQGGTGLGLAIAKWIVDSHGGDIEILTRPEFGTRITVRL